MFRLLASAKRNDLDDGFVVNGHNLDDAETEENFDNKFQYNAQAKNEK